VTYDDLVPSALVIDLKLTRFPGQMLVHANTAPYTPNTLNNGSPKQATQSQGRGFFTAPQRSVSGRLQRTISSTFNKDYWSQPRLIFNSLVPQEKQFLINAIRFETSHIKSEAVKKNVLTQLNRIHHGIAKQVAEVLGMTAPSPDAKFYHDNKTAGVSVFGSPLLKVSGLKVGVLSTVKALDTETAQTLVGRLTREGVQIITVAESLAPGVDQTYSASDATDFDGIVISAGTSKLFSNSAKAASTLFPAGRPLQILLDGYRFGKPVGFVGDGSVAAESANIPSGPGVYIHGDDYSGNGRNGTYAFRANLTRRAEESTNAPGDLAHNFLEGLKTFRFLNRFPVESL
jgi:catalase